MLVLCLCWNSYCDFLGLISCCPPTMWSRSVAFMHCDGWTNSIVVMSREQHSLDTGVRCNLLVFCFYMEDLPLAFKWNILGHFCSWFPVIVLKMELVFSHLEVLFCWIPVCNAFNFKLWYIKVQWSWISVFISLPVKSISFICFPMGGRKKRNGLCRWQWLDWHTG